MAPRSSVTSGPRATGKDATGKDVTGTDHAAGDAADNAIADETLSANFVKPEKLGPVAGRGRLPDPIPDDLRADLEFSLTGCEGPGDGGYKKTRNVNASGFTKLKNDCNKWKAEKEREGHIVKVGYRTRPRNKPSKTVTAPVDFAVTLVAEMA